MELLWAKDPELPRELLRISLFWERLTFKNGVGEGKLCGQLFFRCWNAEKNLLFGFWSRDFNLNQNLRKGDRMIWEFDETINPFPREMHRHVHTISMTLEAVYDQVPHPFAIHNTRQTGFLLKKHFISWKTKVKAGIGKYMPNSSRNGSCNSRKHFFTVCSQRWFQVCELPLT